jgi:Mce-associated membrane protein
MSVDKTEQRESESDEVEVETSDDADETLRDDDTGARRRRLNLAPPVLVLLLAISGALATWVYLTQYRPDEQTDEQTVHAVTTAAQEGMTALLSYKSETLDNDVTAAKSHLTGDFLNDYEKRIREVVAPAVKGKGVETVAQIIGAGVSELHPDSAVVLVFLDEVTVSKDRPDPAMAASSVLVSLTKVHGKWLITKFQPI